MFDFKQGIQKTRVFKTFLRPQAFHIFSKNTSEKNEREREIEDQVGPTPIQSHQSQSYIAHLSPYSLPGRHMHAPPPALLAR
jgi:hypothetical protein